MELKPCTRDQFGDIKDQFKTIEVEKLYCMHSPKEIFIEGTFESAFYSRLNIYLERCNNATNNNRCQSPEKIDEMI